VGRDWALGAAPGVQPYVRCTACGTFFAHPQPSDEVLAAAYPASYGGYAERTALERLLEPLARVEARQLIAHADPGGSLVELGCGSGRFLERLRESGWKGRLSGVEPDAGAARATAARLGIPVEVARAEDAALTPGGHDVVVLRHVLEHVRQPGELLGLVRERLARGGLLYVATPDPAALAARVFGRWWYGWEVPRHLTVFSTGGLAGLLARHGFEVVEERRHYAPQMWSNSLRLALDRGRGSRWARVAAHPLNPLVGVPAAALGAVELPLRRSTMYSVLARSRRA
jgi:SAM-dependent methyltransferase